MSRDLHRSIWWERETGNTVDGEFMYENFKNCLVNNNHGIWFVKLSLASTRNWVQPPELKKVGHGGAHSQSQSLGGGGRQDPGACWPVSLVYLVTLRPARASAQKQKEDVIRGMESRVIFWPPHVHEHLDTYVQLHVYTLTARSHTPDLHLSPDLLSLEICKQ